MARSALRTLTALAAILLVPTVGALTAAPASAASGPGFPRQFAAPYVQTDRISLMASDRNATGLKYYTLAFITANGCRAQWEADTGTSVGGYSSAVSSLRAAGGDIIVSFGGAGSRELAQACSESQLESVYGGVIDAYDLTRVDFDIEGGVMGDTAATDRRNQALANLQRKYAQQGKTLAVDYTLAVDPSGLPSREMNLLKNAKSHGLDVNLVNAMIMDFGDGENPLKDGLSAANAMHGQLGSIWNTKSSDQLWAMEGLTPIAGRNDDNETFSTSDAQTLVDFAKSKGVTELAFWEVAIDSGKGYAYSKIFNKVTGGSTGGGGDTTPPSTPTGLHVTGANSSSVSLAWTASTDDTGVTGYDVFRDGSLATSTPGPSATVSGLSPSTSYSFTVKAKDAAGHSSAASSAATGTTTAGTGGGDPLVSRGKAINASSEGGTGYVATNANDGNTATRWASVSHVDPQWIRIDLGAKTDISRVSLQWDASCATSYALQVSDNDSTWTTAYSTTTGDGGIDDVSVNAAGRYVRMYGTVRCRDAGYSLQEFNVYGTASTGGGGSTLLSQGKAASASSEGSTGYAAKNAFDGSTATRWASVSHVDPQWLRVDLGASHALSSVKLTWDLSCATSYSIQVSTDGSTFTTVYSTTTGDGGVDSIPVSATGRYVRMFGTARCRDMGYSVEEMQVYGS
jgi:chitinase